MTSEGVFTGMPHPLFVSGIPAVDDAPEFTLKKVDDATICKVQQRYDAAHERVDRLFSQGEWVYLGLSYVVSHCFPPGFVGGC